MDFIISYLITQCKELFYRLITCKEQKYKESKGLTIQELFIINLKAYRKIHKISQTQLADLCDSSTGYIGEIESGKRFPSVNMIERIANALEIESWNLFKNEPASPTHSASSVKLTPTQKEEIVKLSKSAISKILENF
jgi:transcriptional regulator with XRE-family HTH domain